MCRTMLSREFVVYFSLNSIFSGCQRFERPDNVWKEDDRNDVNLNNNCGFWYTCKNLCLQRAHLVGFLNFTNFSCQGEGGRRGELFCIFFFLLFFTKYVYNVTKKTFEFIKIKHEKIIYTLRQDHIVRNINKANKDFLFYIIIIVHQNGD